MFRFAFNILTYALHALPPMKRLQKYIIFLQSLLYPIYWRKGYFDKYISANPSDFAVWSTLTTYANGDEVVSGRTVYVSLADGNTSNIPAASPNKWFKVNDSYIGANERLRYNATYLTLTWALNRQFTEELTALGLVGFRQPPYPAPYDYGLGGGTFSDIYITNDVPSYLSLIGFPTLRVEDTTYPTISGYVGFPTLITGTETLYKFDINVPTAFYASLGVAAESIIRKFADTYVPSGVIYAIVQY